MSAFSVDSMSHEPFSSTSSQRIPPDACVPELVSVQATAIPEAIALADNEDVLTYGELEARADQLAQYLRTLRVSSNVVVGLCVARSIAMVVGALGILKAGGAYLPLDPSYPSARLAFQLKDAQVPVVITGRCTMERLPVGSWHVVALDREGRQTDSHGNSNGPESYVIKMQDEDLAYVIYTSGSTGQPKGVEITHASLRNLVSWHQQAFVVTPSDRASLQASPGFDAAVWELWPYLTAGASVHISDDDTRSDPERFRNWLVEHAITVAFAPTPIAERMIQLKWPTGTALRSLLTGADTLRHYPPATLPFTLVNNYGPTECTVVTTSGTVPADGIPDQRPSIGWPITNTQVYILDEHLRQQPPGISGELYIGGAGLARGYRNRPDLTTERFVYNPFSNQPRSRLYRTGDMACYLPDGQVAFLGRIDDQVKIRGHRVEPDEVTSVLDRHPLVHASVVTGCEDISGEKRLVAYVVPKERAHITAKVLREFLLLHLPDYLVPAAFFQLDVLPLTTSGKIDRKALPSPAHAHQLTDDEYVAPRTALEERMTGILASLLHLDSVGVKDNFFLLGGNSLLGAQVIARVRDAFGVELSLLNLFNHPSVCELDAEIEQLLVAKLEGMSEDEAVRLVSPPGNASFL